MIWFLVLLGGLALAFFASRKRSPTDGAAHLEGGSSRQHIAAGVTLTAQIIRPDPAEWEREREERKRAREAAVARLRASFIRPESLVEAVAGVRRAIASLAHARSRPPPNIDSIFAEIRHAGTPAKMEQAVRKRLNQMYKLRSDPEKLHEALACCVIQVQLLLEHRDQTWKVANALKRIATNLDNEHYRRAAVGFLLVVGDALQQDRQDAAETCKDEAARLFSNWHADEEARATFQTDVAHLVRAPVATDKHFLINGLVGYLNRRRRFDPTVRAQLVELCEQDVALYKAFLADLNSDSSARVSFARAVQSKNYICPRLPSFDILWDLFEEERDLKQLRRLQKIAREIKYGNFEIDEELEAAPAAPGTRGAEGAHTVEAAAPPDAPSLDVPTEVIEVRKSGQTGKLAFLNAAGEPCSTEDAAQDYFHRLGWKTLRAEVRFWQAMFGLAFWDEIFAGSGAPNALNDIPLDLFSGAAFYEARRAAIEAKAATIGRSDLRQFIAWQVRRYGSTWTRIVFDAPRGDFSYRRVLESTEVLDFLSTIAPATFARIVHRIASNPNDHRAGLPDFVMWKDGVVLFVEVKGIREKVRDSQLAWFTWMQVEHIAVKVVRVKGLAVRGDAASAAT